MRQQRDWKQIITDILIDKRKYRDIDYTEGEMAYELGVTQSTLSRAIKNTFGKTFTEFVRPLQVKDAAKMLKNPNKNGWTIDEIGLKAGFANRQSFFTYFKKYMGDTPENYRKKNKK